MSANGPKIRREPVSFASGANTLRGMVHSPAEGDYGDPAVILLSAGLKNRIGYARLYVSMADHLAAHGFPVMRFDYHGCGDSDGRLSPTGAYQELHADINGLIQTGLFADDTLAAMRVMREKYSCEEFFLCGLCGGSNTAVYTGVRSDDVLAIMLLNLPIVVDSARQREKREGKMSLWQAQFMYETYLKKLISPRAWLRFFSLKSDYKSMKYILRKRLSGAGAQKDPREKEYDDKGDTFNFNFDLLDRFNRYFGSGRFAYLYFAENDSTRPNFDTYFENRHGAKLLKKHVGKYEKRVFQNANHSFVSSESRARLFERIVECVEREKERLPQTRQ